jgi:hypothetical protein
VTRVVASALQGLLVVTLSPVLPLTASIKGEIDRLENRLPQVPKAVDYYPYSASGSLYQIRAPPVSPAPSVSKVPWIEQALDRRAAAAEAVKGLVQGSGLGGVLYEFQDAGDVATEVDCMPSASSASPFCRRL